MTGEGWRGGGGEMEDGEGGRGIARGTARSARVAPPGDPVYPVYPARGGTGERGREHGSEADRHRGERARSRTGAPRRALPARSPGFAVRDASSFRVGLPLRTHGLGEASAGPSPERRRARGRASDVRPEQARRPRPKGHGTRLSARFDAVADDTGRTGFRKRSRQMPCSLP